MLVGTFSPPREGYIGIPLDECGDPRRREPFDVTKASFGIVSATRHAISSSYRRILHMASQHLGGALEPRYTLDSYWVSNDFGSLARPF